MDPWIEQGAEDVARRAPRELEALVAVSSPSGDVHGADECASLCAALAPDAATCERVPCSSPGHADDLVIRLQGTGTRKALLVGHNDTVVGHAEHKPLTRVGEQLVGSGSVDMKGGNVLALGALRAFAQRPELYDEIALLLVCDEEWRTADFSHVPRFADFDACYASPKVRAWETASLACAALNVDPVREDSLANGFGRVDALALIEAHDGNLLVVGHEPSFSQVVYDFSGARVDFKKGGIVALSARRTGGELLVALRPKEIEAIAAALRG
jgi:phosphohistidine phosphatase SixA